MRTGLLYYANNRRIIGRKLLLQRVFINFLAT